MRSLCFWLLVPMLELAAATPPPAKIEFPSKRGVVVFDHAAHVKREKDACSTCHDKLWPQSTATPLPNSSGCHTCHKEGGKAFSARARENCDRCHPVPKDEAGK